MNVIWYLVPELAICFLIMLMFMLIWYMLLPRMALEQMNQFRRALGSKRYDYMPVGTINKNPIEILLPDNCKLAGDHIEIRSRRLEAISNVRRAWSKSEVETERFKKYDYLARIRLQSSVGLFLHYYNKGYFKKYQPKPS